MSCTGPVELGPVLPVRQDHLDRVETSRGLYVATERFDRSEHREWVLFARAPSCKLDQNVIRTCSTFCDEYLLDPSEEGSSWEKCLPDAGPPEGGIVMGDVVRSHFGRKVCPKEKLQIR
uniref:Apple domain-containing protein n=1 Tax=Steinernema glaseri TaxID=37863 RepID=A0A1I7ZM38_9BILA